MYTKEDLEKAYNAGVDSVLKFAEENQKKTFEEWFNYQQNSIDKEEEKLQFPFWVIKEICGWQRWCDVVGGNHYATCCGTIEDTEIFYCTESQARELGLI